MTSPHVLGHIPGGHMYVDESTANDYLVMCAVIANSDVAPTRKAMRELLLPRQKSLHMKNDKKRAPKIIQTIVELRPTILILACEKSMPDLEARSRCIQRLTAEACAAGLSRVMLDPIESLERRDRSWIHQGARAAGHAVPPFDFGHQQRHEEPMMWIADAAGWAWQRGGEIRKQIAPVVTVVNL